jgi:hypothetical protein
MSEKLKNTIFSTFIGAVHFTFYWFYMPGISNTPAGILTPIALSVVAALILYYLSRRTSNWVKVMRVAITFLPLLFTLAAILLFSIFYR